MTLRLLIIAIGCSAALAVPALAETEPASLRVCLDQESPPFSFKTKSAQGGYDLSVAVAVAGKLGRPLEIQWFDGDHSDNSRADLEVNALLSARKCDLAGGYALFYQQLGQPVAHTWFLPRHQGGRGGPRSARVALGSLKPSQPYHALALVLALGSKTQDRTITTLRDAQGLRLGSYVLSLADRVLMNYHGGIFASSVTHLGPKEDLLAKLDEGSIDAALIEQSKLDTWHATHPESKVRSSGFRHSLAFNVGFVGLDGRDDALLSQVDTALDELGSDGTLERLARESQLTYLPPRPPAIQPRITFAALRGD